MWTTAIVISQMFTKLSSSKTSRKIRSSKNSIYFYFQTLYDENINRRKLTEQNKTVWVDSSPVLGVRTNSFCFPEFQIILFSSQVAFSTKDILCSSSVVSFAVVVLIVCVEWRFWTNQFQSFFVPTRMWGKELYTQMGFFCSENFGRSTFSS